MRIVGGTFKGRVLKSFDGTDIRPTSDMARESLFNILRDRIVGARFLDLFCGTGAMGIEAISRGAEFVQFNDYSKKSIALVKDNLSKLGISNGISVTYCDALRVLEGTSGEFDIIFMDPPYADGVGIEALKKACLALGDNGIVIFENELGVNEPIEGLVKYDERKYGKARFTFYKRA